MYVYVYVCVYVTIEAKGKRGHEILWNKGSGVGWGEGGGEMSRVG